MQQSCGPLHQQGGKHAGKPAVAIINSQIPNSMHCHLPDDSTALLQAARPPEASIAAVNASRGSASADCAAESAERGAGIAIAAAASAALLAGAGRGTPLLWRICTRLEVMCLSDTCAGLLPDTHLDSCDVILTQYT